MVTTPLTLVFLGAMALTATFGLFYQFRDRWTGVLVGFTSSVLWGLFGLGAMDVVVYDTTPQDASASIDVLVWVGFGFAVLTALYSVYDFFNAFSREAKETDVESVMGP